MTDILKNVPNPPFEVEIMDKEPVEVANPYTGQKVMLEPIAVAVYDCIKGAEYMENAEMMKKGMDWFAKHYPNEYMVLLD
tara:strand:+ start:314 stop:553 length:240 start_codon:yes stop_codon:yes gene_type:complete